MKSRKYRTDPAALAFRQLLDVERRLHILRERYGVPDRDMAPLLRERDRLKLGAADPG